MTNKGGMCYDKRKKKREYKMLDFIYNTPTKVYFGKGRHKEIGKILADYGYQKIMMQYGKGSVKASGLYEEILCSLQEYKIQVIECGGVEPNPKVEFVRHAVRIAKEEKVEMILAVGGGSVLDSSKITAIGAMTDADAWDIQKGEALPKSALPVGCILTIAAAGSEMSNSAVLSSEAEGEKRGINTELNRLQFAVMNPELTFSVSKYQTACGIVDMMTHTLERYFMDVPPTPLTDRISEAILKSIVEAGQVVMQNPCDYDARATLMWASSLSHNGLTGCGRINALPVHKLEHAVSGLYDKVAHGAGLAVLYPAWARYVYKYAPSRFGNLARAVWGVVEEDDEKASLLGIERMEQFFSQIEMPKRLAEFGIQRGDLEKLALLCTANGRVTVPSYLPLGLKEIKEIFESCY